MADRTIGKLRVKVEADTKNANDGIDGIGSKLRKLNENARKSANAFGKWALGISTAAAAATAAIVKSNLTSIDSLAKTADKLGVTTEALQGMRHAAELTGVSAGTMDTAMQRLTRRVSEAAQGVGVAKGALEELNLVAEDLNKISPDEQMLKIAGAMEQVTNQGDRVRLAMQLFDTEGVALVNTLAAGEQGLKDMAGEVDALGASISRVDAAKIEMANDAIERGQMAASGFGKALTVAVAPSLIGVIEKLTEANKELNIFGKTAENVFSFMVSAAGFVGNAIRGIQIIVKGLEVAFRGFGALVWSVWSSIATAIDTGINTTKEIVNNLINDLNRLPGVDIENLIVGKSEVAKFFESVAETATSGMQEAQAELAELALTPLPSETIEKFVENAEALAQVRAEKTAEEIAAAQDRQDQLTSIEEEGVQERIALNEHQAAAIEMNTLSMYSSILSAIGAFATKSKALSKVIRITQGALSAYQVYAASTAAAAQALAQPPGPPATIPFAASIAAAGKAQAASVLAGAVASTFSGGGGRGGAGFGAARRSNSPTTRAQSQAQQQDREVTVNLVGNTQNADIIEQALNRISKQEANNITVAAPTVNVPETEQNGISRALTATAETMGRLLNNANVMSKTVNETVNNTVNNAIANKNVTNNTNAITNNTQLAPAAMQQPVRRIEIPISGEIFNASSVRNLIDMINEEVGNGAELIAT